jgi:hypothetical protein
MSSYIQPRAALALLLVLFSFLFSQPATLFLT